MAHIRRHPNAKGRWQVRYVDPSGKERAKNFPRKSDAEKFLVTIATHKLLLGADSTQEGSANGPHGVPHPAIAPSSRRAHLATSNRNHLVGW